MSPSTPRFTVPQLLVAFVVVVIGTGALLLPKWLRQQEPNWTFDLASVVEARDVTTLLHLARQCEQIDAWVPEAAGPGVAGVLTRHVKNPANGFATTWKQLCRAGRDPAVATLNGAILLVAEQLPDSELGRLRLLPDVAVEAGLCEALAASVRQRRREAVAQLVRASEVAGLLTRLSHPPPPSENRQRWTEALLAALADAKEDLARRAGWAQTAERLTTFDLGQPDAPGLTIRRQVYANPTQRSLRHSNSQLHLDCAVWERGGTTAGARTEADVSGQQNRDTGLRLHGLTLAQVNNAFQPAWPPRDVVADDEAFARYLAAAGFPSYWRVTVQSVEAGGTRDQPHFLVRVRATHPDVADWKWSDQLKIDGQPGLTTRVARLATAARRWLLTHLPRVTTWHRLKTRFHQDEGERFTATVALPTLGEVRMRGQLGDDGRLVVTGLAGLTEETKLLDGLAQADRQLAAVRESLAVEQLAIEGNPARVKGTLRLTPIDAELIQWELAPDQELSVKAPQALEKITARLPKPPAGGLPPTKEDVAAVQATLSGEVESRFPKLKAIREAKILHKF